MQLFMHLTNFSLNKFSETFDEAEGEGEGSKVRARRVALIGGNMGYIRH